MTREDKLYSMNGTTLIKVADKLGVKVACNKNRTALKEAKANVIARILAAEEEIAGNGEPLAAEQAKTEKAEAPTKAPKSPIKASDEPKADKTTPKKTNMKLSELTYNGKTKSIKEWAEEIGMPTPTLYDRVNRNGWSVEEAIEIPLGQRRKNVCGNRK